MRCRSTTDLPRKLGRGASYSTNGETVFTVWAPLAERVDLALRAPGAEREESLVMEPTLGDLFTLTVEAPPGSEYLYVLDGARRRPDPVSRHQPDGVHGPSEVVDPGAFTWSDDGWSGIPLEELIMYEMHVGTYTEDGTFESVIPHLDYLKNDLGVSCIELMPVGQFPGARNWGYDGAYLFAPQNSYGGPTGLSRLVDACHRIGLAVVLDVVYNHVGPEGNFLGEFGPYFSDRHRTPWGLSMNYDGYGCDEVRLWATSNATYWIREYHLDGLRLDAIHGIFDSSPRHVLEEIGDSVHAEARSEKRLVHVIAESDLNDPRVVKEKKRCGYGLDGQWSDDFHHSLHALLTGERFGYYGDFGTLQDVEKAVRDGFVYDGRYSKFRGRRHGASSVSLPGSRLVVCIQNHDQVGNRPDGARLGMLVDSSTLRMAAGLMLLSPYVPLLFMGEEFAADTPFYYFVSHTDPLLSQAVREGRKKEFERFSWATGYIDPVDPSTYERSKIDHGSKRWGTNLETFLYYQRLIRLRREHPSLRIPDKGRMRTTMVDDALLVHRWRPGGEQTFLVCVLGSSPLSLDRLPEGTWTEMLDSDPARSQRRPPVVRVKDGAAAGSKLRFSPRSLTVYATRGHRSVRAIRRADGRKGL